MLFFYDKTGWLAERHAALTAEVKRRGYAIEARPPLVPIAGLAGSWEPTSADHALSLGRLAERLATQNHKYYGQPVAADFYTRLGDRYGV
jgi:hypothetical protein